MTLTTGLPMVMISKDLNTNDDGTGIIHWLSIMAPNLSLLNYLMKFVISFSHVWISLSLSLSPFIYHFLNLISTHLLKTASKSPGDQIIN